MIGLLSHSYLLLLRIDVLMKLRHLRAIHDLVTHEPVREHPADDGIGVEAICHAVDLACALYVKPVMCLQRSAATALLLKRFGWKAELVIGAQIMPFKTHAWTEVGGRVVNDRPSVVHLYTVLDRC
jgi:hypothetical protein